MKLFESQIAKLKMSNCKYRKFVTEVLELFLKEDLGSGDVTIALLASPQKIVKAEIRAKENGTLAGVEEAEFFLKKHGIKILKQKKDGANFQKNEIVFEISGAAEKILTLERAVLNLLQRMSGIATISKKLAQKTGKRKFSATRKTPLGLLDVKAVVVGGGLPHRLNLEDQILVKENHRAVDANCWKKIQTRDYFEIEANCESLALEIVRHFSKAG